MGEDLADGLPGEGSEILKIQIPDPGAPGQFAGGDPLADTGGSREQQRRRQRVGHPGESGRMPDQAHPSIIGPMTRLYSFHIALTVEAEIPSSAWRTFRSGFFLPSTNICHSIRSQNRL